MQRTLGTIELLAPWQVEWESLVAPEASQPAIESDSGVDVEVVTDLCQLERELQELFHQLSQRARRPSR